MFVTGADDATLTKSAMIVIREIILHRKPNGLRDEKEDNGSNDDSAGGVSDRGRGAAGNC